MRRLIPVKEEVAFTAYRQTAVYDNIQIKSETVTLKKKVGGSFQFDCELRKRLAAL